MTNARWKKPTGLQPARLRTCQPEKTVKAGQFPGTEERNLYTEQSFPCKEWSNPYTKQSFPCKEESNPCTEQSFPCKE